MVVEVVTQENFADFVRANTPDENGQMPVVVGSGGESTLVDPGNKTPSSQADGNGDKPADAKGSDKPANAMQERINELTRLRKEADEFAEGEYNARLRSDEKIKALETEIANLKAAIPKPADDEAGKPDPAKYAKGEEQKYIEDLSKWTADRAVAKDRAEQERLRNENAATAEQQRINETYNARVSKFKEITPDFAEKIQASADAPVRPWITEAIKVSKDGPQLAYHLATNPDVRTELNKLSAYEAVLELGQIAKALKDPVVKLDSQRKPVDVQTQASTRTRLPAPITPVSGGEATVDKDPRQPMPYAEYKALRRAGKIK